MVALKLIVGSFTLPPMSRSNLSVDVMDDQTQLPELKKIASGSKWEKEQDSLEGNMQNEARRGSRNEIVKGGELG